VIAGVIVTLMLLVQMSVAAYFREAMSEESSPALQATWQGVNQVQLGLDVAWDVFIGIGTLLFAVSVLGHPRLGRLFGGTGIVIAIGLLILNFATFPTPPAEAGSVDLGPLVGLWYLSVSIQVLRSLGWVEKRFLETSG
jgi:hypothetical protein